MNLFWQCFSSGIQSQTYVMEKYSSHVWIYKSVGAHKLCAVHAGIFYSIFFVFFLPVSFFSFILPPSLPLSSYATHDTSYQFHHLLMMTHRPKHTALGINFQLSLFFSPSFWYVCVEGGGGVSFLPPSFSPSLILCFLSDSRTKELVKSLKPYPQLSHPVVLPGLQPLGQTPLRGAY